MTFDEQLRVLTETSLLDGPWYLQSYPDVGAAGMDPAAHYLKYGALMGRDPGPDFSTRFYLKRNRDVGPTKINPLVHYLKFGRAEGRDPRP